MKKLMILLVLLPLFALNAAALDLQPPTVPESAVDLMPSDPTTLGDGLFEVLRNALMFFRPDLKEAAGVCAKVLCAAMLIALVKSFPKGDGAATDLAGTVGVAVILLNVSNSMIKMAAEAVVELSEYGKLLLPVLSGALAAQGGITASASLYAGTVLFDSLLSSLIAKILIPMIYLFLALSVAAAATGEDMLSKFQGTVKWAMTWSLKTILYLFTGYIGITGVVSGTTDAAALKAAKLTISGMVPVVGGILSDASEAVLVSAGTVKSAVGLYGLFAVLAIWLSPFLKIGAHYLLLKGTAALCGIFGSKRITDLVSNFSAAMGLLLGMSGAVCLMLMISTICFMKGAV